MKSDPKIHPLGGGPTRCTTLPEDSAGRKAYPIATGFLDYFPDAIAELAHMSHVATAQHHPDKPTHWDRNKSMDQDNTAMRHFLQRGTKDIDGQRHSIKAAWRMLAIAQLEIEEEQRQLAAATNEPCVAWSLAPEACALPTRPTPLALTSGDK